MLLGMARETTVLLLHYNTTTKSTAMTNDLSAFRGGIIMQ